MGEAETHLAARDQVNLTETKGKIVGRDLRDLAERRDRQSTWPRP